MDVFDDAVLDAVRDEFPAPATMFQRSQAEEVKLSESRWDRLGPTTRHLISELNSAPFVDALEQLTGVQGLICDHHLVGGGLHEIRPGGFLGVHADFNRHAQLGLHRRLNVLLYLNRDWDTEWGGELELWDTAMTAPVVRQPPTFNTMVVFSTTSDTFHGHPDPLRSPEGVTRRSVAMYYYTAPVGDGPVDSHSTLFQNRPDAAPFETDTKKAMRHFRSGIRLLLPDGLVNRVKRR